MDPRACWPDGTPVGNPFRPGSFRWSLIAQWEYWEDDTVKGMAEIMDMAEQNIRDAIGEVFRKTGWRPPVKRSQAGRAPGG